MADILTPKEWLEHLQVSEGLEDYLAAEGSLIRVAAVREPVCHDALRASLAVLADELGLATLDVSAANCMRLHYPEYVLRTIADEADMLELFRSCAQQVWSAAGYLDVGCQTADIAEATNEKVSDLTAQFRTALKGLREADRNLNRDFSSLLWFVLLGVINGGNSEREAVANFRAYLKGTLSSKEIANLGIHRKVSRSNATLVLRNLLALYRFAGWSGTLVHLDLRWATDHEILRGDNLQISLPTKQSRTWIYQWIRELIDGMDGFTATFICVEFGGRFPDPSLSGRGWGLYDALRLRIEDGVKPVSGQNPSAPFVELET